MGGYCPTTSISLSLPDWSFDLLGIDEREDGIYLGTDSGCSCPRPWESHTKDDFTGPLTVEQAREEALSLRRASGYGRISVEEFTAELDEALGLN